MSKIQDFLCNNSGVDHRGRTIEQILSFDDDLWNECHDFIQWLFPLPIKSKFFSGEDCTVLTEQDLTDLWENTLVQGTLVDCTNRFCKFLGLDLFMPFGAINFLPFGTNYTTTRYRVSLSKNFSSQSKYWLRTNDHNHLRINRMLQCLVLFGLENLAKEIFRCLVMIKCEFEDCISDETMVYWRNALSGYSY